MRQAISLISLFLSCLALVIALLAYSHKKDVYKSDDFTPKLQSQIRACVDYNKMPQKKETFHLLNELEKKGYILEIGSGDSEVKFINVQGCIEHVLACAQAMGEITALVGAFHTPTIAEPFCTRAQPLLEQNMLDESIQWDLDKLLNVRPRAQIVREFLMKGGDLYVVYPEGGLSLRSPEEIDIYREELAKYAIHLFDAPLNCVQMDPDMVGTTYLFKNREKNVFAFSIKAKASDSSIGQAEWGVWLSMVKDPNMARRLNELFDYFVSWNGPDLRSKI